MKKIDNYFICYEPMQTPGLALLDEHERKEYNHLYEKALTAPKEMLPAIEEFRNKHQDLPEIENLLALVYLYLKQIDKVEQLIEQSYHRFPNYLFARINYADQCLRRKKTDCIPGIFENCFDLSMLYPNKHIFHVSEFRGFMTLMSLYHLALQEKEKALHFYQLAHEADPNHPTVLSLKKKLFRTSFLKKIAHILKIK